MNLPDSLRFFKTESKIFLGISNPSAPPSVATSKISSVAR